MATSFTTLGFYVLSASGQPLRRTGCEGGNTPDPAAPEYFQSRAFVMLTLLPLSTADGMSEINGLAVPFPKGPSGDIMRDCRAF